jgi:hypothetical protein
MIELAIFDQLSDLRCAVARSRAAIAEGANIEMNGLEAEIMPLLAAAKHTGPSLREDLLITLEALRHDLDGLESDLRRQHDAALAPQATSAYDIARSQG